VRLVVEPVTLRVAARFQARWAYEFSSPEVLKEYLHDHPQADKTKHTVKSPEHHENKPKKSWSDIAKGLTLKAQSFVRNAPDEIKKFVNDEHFRSRALMAAHKALIESPEKFVGNAWKQAKHEVHEFKEAGEGIRSWMSGNGMSKEQASAFRKVATHVAIATAAGALGAGIATGAGAAAISKGVLGAFISSSAKKIVVKSVLKRLEHLPAFEEIAHIGHHLVELADKFAAEEETLKDPEEVMQLLITAAVAKSIKELDPETLQEAIEDAAGGVSDER
jgi:hypothetical protein